MADRRSSKPTLLEVANAAGVSITAASKVLSGGVSSARVSEQTAAHVRAVAHEMRYVRNANARSLRTRKTETIGLVFENLGHLAEGPLFNAMMLDGIAKEVFKRKNRLTIISQLDEQHSVANLQDGRLDGVVWCKLSRDSEQLENLRLLHLPGVALCSVPPESPHPFRFFSCDNEAGATLVADRMAELGHRRVLFLLEEGEEHTPDAQARLNGFVKACAKHGISISSEDIRTWRYECEELAAWWQSKPPQTAIFAWNESMAGNTLKQAAKLGISVPDELSVVGFDSTPYCETTVPKLTAVRQPISDMARAAVEHLFRLIDGEETDDRDIVFSCTLDERESLSIAPKR